MILRKHIQKIKEGIKNSRLNAVIRNSASAPQVQNIQNIQNERIQNIQSFRQDDPLALVRDVDDNPVVKRSIENSQRIINSPKRGNYFRNDKKGITPIGIFFTVIVFLIVWAMFLGWWMNQAVGDAISINELTGIEAFLLANMNLIIFLLLTVFIIVGTIVYIK